MSFRYFAKNLIWSASLFIAGSTSAQTVYPNECFFGELTDYVQSWVANSGGTPRTHVPQSINSIYVHPDGRVVTICNWDEGGTNVGVFKDNQIICIPQYSGTGSYGRNSGNAVTMDDKYIYQLMRFNGRSGANSNMNSNGLPQFPPSAAGVEWQVISRYDSETGVGAKFDLGYGPSGAMLLVAKEEGRMPMGIACTDKYLIVSLPKNPNEELSADSLMFYDKASMSSVPVKRYKVDVAGYISVDKKGYVWMKEGNQIIPINISNGSILERSIINLPDNTNVKSFSIDTKSGRERLLLANSGPDLNILIYTSIYSKPTLTSTFGNTGGILKADGPYKRGQVGPLRFEGPTGVGVDQNGNIYVSNNFVGSTGCTLHCYNENTKKLLWKQEGLIFTATCDFDENLRNRIYCPERIYDMDSTKSQCRLDTLVASSIDPFAFPKDMRLEPNPPSPIKTGVFKRNINGKNYIFVSNMYSTGLAGYRFDPVNYGYIAVPFMKVLADGTTFWYDKNGNGQPEGGETITTLANGGTFSQYVDKKGNLWMADRTEINSGIAKFRLWEVLPQLNSNGFLQYGEEQTYKLPSFISDVSRVLYDCDKDQLIIGGYTTQRPWTNRSLWGQVGTTILIYDDVMNKLKNNIDPETWKPIMQYDIPFDVKNANGVNTGEDAKCLYFTSNYIYTQQQQGGIINLYSRTSGDYIGKISPTAVVENRSGWTDFTYAMNARENSDNTIEILAEENAFAKAVHYRINSLAAKTTHLGDLISDSIAINLADGSPFDINKVHEGDPIYFKDWVLNSARGTVTNRRANIPTRCKVRFRVKDNSSGNIVFTASSAALEQDIKGGERILFTPDSSIEPWHYVSGDYTLLVDVNYGNLGDECDFTNNDDSKLLGGKAIPTGIDGLKLQNNISVFPNPAISQICIEGLLPDINYSVKIVSYTGHTVYSGQISSRNNTIDVSSLIKGIYVMNISSGEGSVNRKVIIEK